MFRDNRGSETIFKPFIFIAGILVISAFVFSLLASSNISGNFNLAYQTVGDKQYAMYLPNGGYDVDSEHIVTRWDHEADTNYRFHETDIEEDDAFIVGIINDNELYGAIHVGLDYGDPFSSPIQYEIGLLPEYRYLDEVVIYIEWGWWSSETTSISYQSILQQKVPGSNQSAVDFNIRHNKTYTLVITTLGEFDDFYFDLYSGNFNIQIGEAVNSENLADSSMWVMLGMILTAQTPDIGPIPNLIMVSVLWPALGFMAYVFVSRVIPFIAGA